MSQLTQFLGEIAAAASPHDARMIREAGDVMDGSMVPCLDHGESSWCYIVKGRHIDSEDCRCWSTQSADCPIHGGDTQ